MAHERAADGRAETFFEEYPSPAADKVAHVVNGFVCSIWGL
ncbi:hypothetical protein [Arsenicicoccus dermatophilus]|nr:hypothetical protein [Arsenicicoccus dermatophilus]